MKITSHWTPQLSRILLLLKHVLLPLIVSLPLNTIAYAVDTEASLAGSSTSKNHNIHILYSSNNNLQSKIAKLLTTDLNDKFPNSHVSQLSPINSNTSSKLSPDLVIAIGIDNIKYTANNFTDTDALLIVSNPAEYAHSKNSRNKNSVLYMSQPYCKQIHFIKEINKQWETISYLNTKEKSIDNQALKQCANKYDIKTYKVTTSHTGSTSTDIKNALANSDLILALPNKNIYNRMSVKNILMTSYRSRKPIIGFSKNFVTAGALAAIYSNSEQITKSAINIIEHYYLHKNTFKKKTNHPELFDISLNNQVFRALNIKKPDTKKLKQTLSNKKSINTGASL